MRQIDRQAAAAPSLPANYYGTINCISPGPNHPEKTSVLVMGRRDENPPDTERRHGQRLND